MPARKATAKTPAEPEPVCPTCRGEGWVPERVCVGRTRREVGTTDAICPRCLSTGIDPTPDRW